jgi:hypothetical protein
VVQHGLASGDGIDTPRWLDEVAALNQPPQVDGWNTAAGQVFRTRQAHLLHERERSFGFCLRSHV